ncbi:MAG: DUF3078 domain-containing protein [Brumimicrobium sp.]|nr:DUF3078 domain-containing protein [Brumimicrobium sp.]
MLRTSILTVFIALTLPVFGQEDTTGVKKDTVPNWKLKSVYSLNLTQSTFTNWAAGGRNNISGLGFINGQANYRNGKIKWNNLLSLNLGGVQYFDEPLQKTDDVIDFQSTLSYQVAKSWFISFLSGFRTQFLEGFANPEDTVRSSAFMAPGYLNLSLGIEYMPSDYFEFMLSPFSGKFTFVQDQLLANQGRFGVEPAEFDSAGNLVTPGENFRAEIGSYIRVKYQQEIMENIGIRSRLELFSNYLDQPQNIDVNGELAMDFKVNKWFSASLQLNVIYDDDIIIEDRFGNEGPRTQFKQVIGVGISYRLANYKEEKKKK